MADLVNGTGIQTVFLPDGSILITQEGTGDTAVASSDYWQWDDVWAAGGDMSISKSDISTVIENIASQMSGCQASVIC